MTHGFDDQGSQFDGDGNLKNWWTDQDQKNFKERGDCIAKQFEAYTYEDLHENGKLVEGESIADLGGLTISHAAFEKTLEGKPTPPPIDGFTEEQRFFLGFAQVWAGSYRPEAARLLVRTNEHPLGISDEWAAVEHAVVREGFWVQRGFADGTFRHAALSDLVRADTVWLISNRGGCVRVGLRSPVSS